MFQQDSLYLNYSFYKAIFYCRRARKCNASIDTSKQLLSFDILNNAKQYVNRYNLSQQLI